MPELNNMGRSRIGVLLRPANGAHLVDVGDVSRRIELVEVALAQYPPLGVSGPEGDELRSAAQLDQIPPSRQLPALLDGAPGDGGRQTVEHPRQSLADQAHGLRLGPLQVFAKMNEV